MPESISIDFDEVYEQGGGDTFERLIDSFNSGQTTFTDGFTSAVDESSPSTTSPVPPVILDASSRVPIDIDPSNIANLADGRRRKAEDLQARKEESSKRRKKADDNEKQSEEQSSMKKGKQQRNEIGNDSTKPKRKKVCTRFYFYQIHYLYQQAKLTILHINRHRRRTERRLAMTRRSRSGRRYVHASTSINSLFIPTSEANTPPQEEGKERQNQRQAAKVRTVLMRFDVAKAKLITYNSHLLFLTIYRTRRSSKHYSRA